jgi:hypothetical protein
VQTPDTPPRRSGVTPRALLVLAGTGLFVWWLLEGYLPPAAPEPARIREEATLRALPGVYLTTPLDGVEGEIAGSVERGLLDALSALGIRVGTEGAPSLPSVRLSGAVEEGEGRIRLALELTQGESGEPLWSGSWEERPPQLAELTSRAASAVEAELRRRALLPAP